jgi:hypothetical protein
MDSLASNLEIAIEPRLGNLYTCEYYLLLYNAWRNEEQTQQMLLIHNITVEGILSSTLRLALNPNRFCFHQPLRCTLLVGRQALFQPNPHVEITHFTFVIMD